jgi:hypothetical protein
MYRGIAEGRADTLPGINPACSAVKAMMEGDVRDCSFPRAWLHAVTTSYSSLGRSLDGTANARGVRDGAGRHSYRQTAVISPMPPNFDFL